MKTPEQWDAEGVCYASVARRIQEDALAAQEKQACKRCGDSGIVQRHPFIVTCDCKPAPSVTQEKPVASVGELAKEQLSQTERAHNVLNAFQMALDQWERLSNFARDQDGMVHIADSRDIEAIHFKGCKIVLAALAASPSEDTKLLDDANKYLMNKWWSFNGIEYTTARAYLRARIHAAMSSPSVTEGSK